MARIGHTVLGVLAASFLAIGCSNGTSGADGKDGKAGTNGSSGVDGENGVDGSKGDDGADGAKGADGADGTDGATGATGADGTDGGEGATGPEGPSGPGTSWLSFENVGFPRTNLEKHQINTSPKANVNGVEVSIGYQTIARSHQDPSKVGKACDLAASPTTCTGTVLNAAGAVLKDDGGADMISNYNDFSSILEAGDKKFLVHSYESLPASIYVTSVTQDGSGSLTATATKYVDVSSVDGLFRTCAGSKTPWGTHISAEEAQIDVRPIEAATDWTSLMAVSRYSELKMMGRYLGVDFTDANTDGAPDIAVSVFQNAYTPYFNGYAVEVAVNASGTPTVKKHYAMGRMGMELAYVMPDNKTTFLTDDVTNGALFMFVADTAGDLSAGTLYAMRFYQSTAAGSSFQGDIEWVSLGHATDAEIKALLHPTSGSRVKFSDIFETDTVQAGNTCNAGFSLVRANGDNTSLECLKLKAGMEKAASRLETRRYAAMKGATAELTKEEGLTYDPDLNRIYIALSDVSSSMGAQTGGDDHINVAANGCGGVWALDLGEWFDENGATITEYAALNWYPLIVGTPVSPAYPATSQFFGNTCTINGLASPDNITYLPKYQVLMIGEDTSKHQNDAMWSYHVPSKRLTRVMTTPYGSEVTSPYWYPNLGGHGYLLTAVQHPYGESDNAKINDAENTGGDSYIGVVGPFPALD